MKHVSDGERLAMAALHKRDYQLKEALKRNNNYREQLITMKKYIGELKEANKILASQVNYLVNKNKQNA